jgi:hypothetical protein
MNSPTVKDEVSTPYLLSTGVKKGVVGSIASVLSNQENL